MSDRRCVSDTCWCKEPVNNAKERVRTYLAYVKEMAPDANTVAVVNANGAIAALTMSDLEELTR